MVSRTRWMDYGDNTLPFHQIPLPTTEQHDSQTTWRYGDGDAKWHTMADVPIGLSFESRTHVRFQQYRDLRLALRILARLVQG